MDKQPVTQPTIQPPQAPQTNVSPNFFSKNKRVLIIISALIILVILIPASIILYPKYINTTKNSTNQKPAIPTPTFTPVNTYTPSKDLVTREEATFFAGEVTDKTNNSITIKGDEKTLKFIVSDKIYFMEIPKILTVSFHDYAQKQFPIIDYNSIKNGDHISATIEATDHTQTVVGGIFFR